MEKALELAPGNPTVLVDLAKSEVWKRRNPRRARELMARARTHALSDLVAIFADWTDGLIELEEGRPRAAIPVLEETYRRFAKFRHASPLTGSTLDQMSAALTLATAAAGDPDAALRHYKQAKPRLIALKHDDIIERCETALGRAVDA